MNLTDDLFLLLFLSAGFTRRTGRHSVLKPGIEEILNPYALQGQLYKPCPLKQVELIPQIQLETD
jgi:hypothetical protein